MHVQEFLRNNSLEELKSQYGIKVREYKDFVGLNYCQINSPKTHPIVIECRSLKLVKGTWEVASRSFDRFYNYGEGNQDFNFDSQYTVVMEKCDGSIIPIWYNKIDKRWEISSRSGIFGETLLDENITFRERILSLLEFSEENFQKFFNLFFDKNFTYIFEYIGADNRIVVPYKNSQLVLLGIRNNDPTSPFQYMSLKDMKKFLEFIQEKINVQDIIRLPIIYSLKDFNDVHESLFKNIKIKNMEEGYVCWNTKDNSRIKIKHPQYVKIHHLRGKKEITKEDALRIVLSGEIDEVTLYIPEYKESLVKAKCIVEDISKTIIDTFEKIKNIETQKEFAKEALKTKNFSPLFFLARKNSNDIDKELRDMDIDHKVKYFL